MEEEQLGGNLQKRKATLEVRERIHSTRCEMTHTKT